MATYLADKSALTRRDTRPAVREVVEPLLLAGELATCGVVDLELLYSASSPKTYVSLAAPCAAYPGPRSTTRRSTVRWRSRRCSPRSPSTEPSRFRI